MINSKFYPFCIALGLSVVFFIIYILLGNQGIILSLNQMKILVTFPDGVKG